MEDHVREGDRLGSTQYHRIPNKPHAAASSQNSFASSSNSNHSSRNKMHENLGMTPFTTGSDATWTGKPKEQTVVGIDKGKGKGTGAKSKWKKNYHDGDGDDGSDDELDILSENASDGTPTLPMSTYGVPYAPGYLPRKAPLPSFRKKKDVEGKLNSTKENDENEAPDTPVHISSVKTKPIRSPCIELESDPPSPVIPKEVLAKSTVKKSKAAQPVRKQPRHARPTRIDDSESEVQEIDVPKKVASKRKKTNKTLERMYEDSAQQPSSLSPGPSSPEITIPAKPDPIQIMLDEKRKGAASFGDESPILGKHVPPVAKKPPTRKGKATESESTTKSVKTSMKPKPKKGKGKASYELPEDKVEQAKSDGPQPFPMTSKDFQEPWEDSRLQASSSKRSSSDLELDDSPTRKKRKATDRLGLPENLAEMSLSQMIPVVREEPLDDPKTLCPYCDSRLPDFPSPLLLRMIEKARSSSYRHSRPGNKLGLKAPLVKYVDICKRHRFESTLLPQARQKGWPTEIDFSDLPRRIQSYKHLVEAILKNRDTSVFWLEIQQDIERSGMRKVTGISGQFSAFEKSQPGYYGEQGAVIIYQTLCNLFPFSSIDSEVISPLTASDFMHRVLVPEIAIALIQEDTGQDIETAVLTLRESSSYGVSMFPDMDKPEGSGGVADEMMRQRARARRKEIEQEEAKEKENAEAAKREKENTDAHSDAESFAGEGAEVIKMDTDIDGHIELKRRKRAKATTTTTTNSDPDFVFSFAEQVPSSEVEVSTKKATRPTKMAPTTSTTELKTPKPKTKRSEVMEISSDDDDDDGTATPKPTATIEPSSSAYTSSSTLRNVDEFGTREKKSGASRSKGMLSSSSQPLALVAARSQSKHSAITKSGKTDIVDAESDDNDESVHASEPTRRTSKNASRPYESKRDKKKSWVLSSDCSD